MITVSHDRYFLDKVANKIIAFEDNDIREFFGNYTDYLDEKAFNEQNNEVISKKRVPRQVVKSKVVKECLTLKNKNGRQLKTIL